MDENELDAVDELEAPDAPDADVETAPDPWEGIDPEVRERALAAARAEEQPRFDEMRASYQKRLYNGRKELQEQLGADLDEEGRVVYRDPERFLSTAEKLRGGASRPAPEAERAEPPLETVLGLEKLDLLADEPEDSHRKIAANTQKIVEHRVAQAVEGLSAKLDALTQGFGGFQRATAADSAFERAVSFADELGQGPLADTPEFRDNFRAVLSGPNAPPPPQWTDELMEEAAAIALAHTRRAIKGRGEQLPTQRTQRAEANNNSRAGLGASGASRGLSPAGGYTPGERQHVQRLQQFRQMGGLDGSITPQQAAALESEDWDIDKHAAASRGRNGAR